MKYLKFQTRITKGFTLAEVLITLTIIGVIAALAIPSLIQNTQNAELRTAAKKALSLANQAYGLAVIDNGGGFGPFSTGTMASITKFNAFEAKLNIIKNCPYNSSALGNCWATSGVGAQGVFNNGCSKFTNSPSWQGTNNSFATSDGMFWMLYTYSASGGCDILMVDVNGSRGPNDWGKDVYVFKLNDTNVTPYDLNCNLLHNDNSSVAVSELTSPFKQ